jgi:hypothetical protein
MVAANTPESFWRRNVDVRQPDACWEVRGSRDSQGYGRVRMGGKKRLAHRIAWELANERALRPGEVVRHRCDNPPCCNPAHLLVGTPADNFQDMVERGRGDGVFRGGAANPQAKVTPEQVRLARKLRAEGLRLTDIGERIGLGLHAVWQICHGTTWRDVGREVA